MRFQTKIILLLAVILLALQAINIGVTTREARNAAVTEAERQLVVAADLFNQHVSTIVDGLAERAEVATQDFGFRETIATGDLPTKASVIRNVRDRLGASRAMLLSLEGDVLIDTGDDELTNAPFPYEPMLDEADLEDRSVSIAVLGNRLYALAIVTVKAPIPVAWIGIGIEIDAAMLGDLQGMAALPMNISFLARDAKAPSGWRIVATTATGTEKVPPRMLSRLLALQTDDMRSAEVVSVGETDYVAYLSDVPNAMPREGVSDLLTYSLDTALERTDALIESMIWAMGLAMVVAMAGSVMIARGISRPVRALATVAQRIGSGDYGIEVPQVGSGELGSLRDTMSGMARDIMAREEQLAYMARFDGLTGLPNRREFLRQLDSHAASGDAGRGQLFVVLVAIDRLQDVNNTLGYTVGDELIRTVSVRMTEAITDSLVIARIGSDLFGAACIAPHGTDLMELFLGTRRKLMEPFNVGEIAVDLSVHGGIATFPEAGGDPETLLRNADVALYKARMARRPGHIYDPERDQVDPDRLSLMGEMLRGLGEGHFNLVYQPKADLAHDKITQAEALVRWKHPDRGMIFPDQFIPLAEQTGHIRDLTQWVLRESIRQLAVWRDRKLDLGLGVNLSTQDLLNPELPAELATLMRDHDVPPEALVLEVTESAIMDDPTQALEILRNLSDMRLRLSVDDYGTGYSSMSYLKQLPVDEMKIDKSFVLNLKDSRDDEILVRSTIDLGHNLGLKVTAEGVEDLESYRKLQRLGCHMAQGYFIARPIPPVEFEAICGADALRKKIA